MVEPTVLIPFYRRLIKNASTKEALLIRWRRRRDSNPRYAINVYSLSRGAPSATRPLLRILLLTPFDVSLWSLPGSALLDALRLALRVALVTRALLRDLRSLGQHSATSPRFVDILRQSTSAREYHNRHKLRYLNFTNCRFINDCFECQAARQYGRSPAIVTRSIFRTWGK